MATPILGLPTIAPTQNDKTTTMNDMMVAIEEATQDQLIVDFTSGAVTLSSTQFTRAATFVCQNLGANEALTIPLGKRLFAVRNPSSSYTVTVGGATGTTVAVAPLAGAMIQCDGSNCYLFAAGAQGPIGPTGTPGGGIAIALTFSTSTTAADPGSGIIAFDQATQNTAANIYLDTHDSYGTDWSSVIDTLDGSSSSDKGTIRLFKASAPAHWIVLQLNSRTVGSGYRTLGVTVLGASATNPFINGDSVVLNFDRTGDAGGVSTFQGRSGAVTLEASDVTSALGGTGPVTELLVGAGLQVMGGGTSITSSGTVALGTIAAQSLMGNSGTVAAIPGSIPLSSRFAWTSGTLDLLAAPGSVTTIVAGAGLDGGTITTAGTLSLGAIAAGELLANTGTASAIPTATTPSAVLDLIGSTQGDILYRSGTAWAALAPGAAGQVLLSGGAAANPTWMTAIPAASAGAILAATGTQGIAQTLVLGSNLSLSGGNTLDATGGGGGGTLTVANGTIAAGAITTLDVGSGLTISVAGGIGTLAATGGTGQWSAGTVTTVGGGLTLNSGTLSATGTASLPSIGAGHLLANVGTATATASDTSLTALLDDVLGATQGQIVYRGASAWVALATGSAGQVLESGGASANPSWVTVVPASDTLHILGASGTLGQASAVALSDLLAVSSGTLTLAGAAVHEKFVLSIPGTLSANTQYWTVPIVDAVVIPASFSSPTSRAAAGTAAASVATTLTVSGVTSGTTTTIGTVVCNPGTATPVLNGPTVALTLSAGSLLIAATGGTVDTTLANLGFTMAGTKL